MSFKVNDRVMWKSGTEQYGRIVRIEGPRAVVAVWDDMEGVEKNVKVPLNKLSHD